ncbi:carboxypeptidase-like regulatory domain-containing protein [Natronomonas amylolytica]|uniref:carboxypeptidase-like regulatory domain-containing protein n=1 Tax=Natronomonas amylolytica TaxID=3108498 RepID=UPI0030094B1C
MTHRPTSALLVSLTLALFVSLALAAGAGAAAADTNTGTVTVENGSADGYTVTVAALNTSNQPVVDPTETTVENGTFSYETFDNATTYFIRLETENGAYYELVDATETPAFALNRSVSGTVVDEDGNPVSNATINVMSEHGPQVNQVTVADDGSFSIDPLQPNRTYSLRIEADGAVYRDVVSTDTTNTSREIELASPTDDRDVLELGGGQPVNHLMRVGPTDDGSGLFVVEILSIRNTADRPFVGSVAYEIPSNAETVAGAVQNERVNISSENGTAAVEASIEAGETVEVAAFYRTDSRSLEKPVGYDVESFALLLEQYNLSQAEFSSNLVEADMEMPMVTNTEPLAADDRISMRITNTTADNGTEATPTNSDDGDELPLVPLGLAFVGTIVGGLFVYRRF